MKKAFLLILFAVGSLTISAQLKVTSDGKVKIASSLNTSYANLLVGNYSYASDYSNVGISGSTTIMSGKCNTGVLGTICADPSITNGTNMGVFGVVNPINSGHGRNYGLCGMIGFTGEHYGGAGLYATNYSYCFSHPDNIQGDYAGYFHGSVHITSNLTVPNVFIPSDSRLIDNVVPLNAREKKTNVLDNLLVMNVIEYNIKSRLLDDYSEGMRQNDTEENRMAYEQLKADEMKMSARRHYGIDAEELRNIFPDLVLKGEDGYLSVNYVELVPILIRSIQELKQELDEVKGTSKAMTRSIGDETTDINAVATGNKLYQNTPNPFKGQTIISFSLADDAQNAYICIYDMSGKQLRKMPISSGMENVSIGGWELGEGMFLYSLIVNGQEIDTKKMIITK